MRVTKIGGPTKTIKYIKPVKFIRKYVFYCELKANLWFCVLSYVRRVLTNDARRIATRNTIHTMPSIQQSTEGYCKGLKDFRAKKEYNGLFDLPQHRQRILRQIQRKVSHFLDQFPLNLPGNLNANGKRNFD